MNLINNKFTVDEFVFDVVIPHLNFSGLRKTLETLRTKTPPHNIHKVIVIDQNPEGYQQIDDLVDVHVRLNKNIGFSRACNMGIRISRQSFVFVCNDDIEFLHPKWVEGIVEVFNAYGKRALGVNLASPRNPISSGGPPQDHKDFPPHDNWTDEEYKKIAESDVGKYIYDGVCTWGIIFNREKLEKVESTIPGKCYFDEAFEFGGQDYALNYNAYLTKNEDNDFQGYRMLGGKGVVRHLWYSTKKEGTDIAGVKYDNTFHKKFGLWDGDRLIEQPDIFGNKGIKKIVKNTIRE